MSLISEWERSRALNSQKVALAYGQQSWTFSEFDDITGTIARNLLAAGLRRGDRVAIHLLNSPEFAFTSFACLRAGCIAVPVNTRLKSREIKHVLRHSQASCYVGEPHLYAQIYSQAEDDASKLGPDLIYLTGQFPGSIARPFSDLLEKTTAFAALPEIAPEQLGLIVYTSGTTAQPKGVMHSHRGLRELAKSMRSMHLDESQVVLILSSMAHMVGFAMFMTSSLLNGATLVITRPFEFGAALDNFMRWRVTYTGAFPVIFGGLLTEQTANNRDVSSGRTFLCGGDCVDPTLQRAFGSVFAPICETYGATELTPLAWNRPDRIRVGSLGNPVENVSMRLLDSNEKEVLPGEIGEVCAQGSHMMEGYWRDPIATEAALRNGWFHTGDLARRDGNGYYWFAGRKKEIIIRGGSNISPQEVEAVLCEHPAVSQAAAVGQPDIQWGECVVGHVVLRPGHAVSQAELIAFARERLADYKTPEHIFFHAELPLGPTGKVLRSALRESGQADRASA